MHCPNDGSALAPDQYEQAVVHVCRECQGEFVAGEDLREIVNRRDAARRDASSDAAGTPSPAPTFEPTDPEATSGAGRRACPACAIPMRRVNYAVDTGVMIDRCESCDGVWLDADELEQVQEILERWDDERAAKMAAIAGVLQGAREHAQAKAQGPAGGRSSGVIGWLIRKLTNAA